MTASAITATPTISHPDFEDRGDQIVGTCPACGARAMWPNKGLGRVHASTWATRHQHPVPAPAPKVDDA